MKSIEIALKEEKNQLQKIIEEAKRRLTNAPKGHLRISKKRRGVEYYYKEIAEDSNQVEKKRSNNGRYIRKEEHELAEMIAQRDYDSCIVKYAEERVNAIEKFLEQYGETSLKDVYQKTNPYRQKLICPVILSDEEYIKQWQAVAYKGKAFEDEENEIITERGERVRSKSEKIIADKLYALGIPYRYEYPLMLAGNVRVYPDFTILKMPEREEVYLEHFGMMDNVDYVENAMYKLNTYEKNKLYLGVNLFITRESSRSPLNTRALDGMLRRIFCEK